MKLTKDEFLKLQQQWYQKLSDLGFKDIEKTHNEELIQTASYCYRDADEFQRAMKEEYFRCIGQLVHDEETVFRNEIDQYVLSRHADGAKIKAIVYELACKGMDRDRKSVRIIIRRYEMAWGLRVYGRKQLHRK